VSSIRFKSRCIKAALVLLPLLRAQELKIEKVESKLSFAEGPVWTRDGSLIFSDAPNNRILKWTPNEKTTLIRADSQGANGITLDAQGRLYMCESHSRQLTRMDKKGNIEVLAAKYRGKRLNAPNDVVVRRDGQIYFTDPAFGNQQDTRELDFFGVYHINLKGEISLIAKPVGRPNGIAISHNGRALYVANSDEKNVRAYDLDKNGEASNERIAIADIPGVPDGLRVDEKGNFYVAAQGILVYDAAGKLTRTILIGETPANCAFGDADFETLYVTARTSVYRVRLDVKGSVQY
jgi:sugar lactone lactonase YvrE